MAARPEASPLAVVELRSITPAALDLVLTEERARWRTLLHWDFSPSAELVMRYTEMQALDGFALTHDGEPVGYIYWITEDHKGLLGDLYVRDAWRSPANENALLGAAMRTLRRNPWIRRVEAQLLQLGARGPQVSAEGIRPEVFRRHFMVAPGRATHGLRSIALDPPFRIEPWSMRWIDEAAALIARVYSGHIDSQINDQYNSEHGARRFLQNIVQYPGCGHFSHRSSFVALDEQRHIRGVALASKVAGDAGHIAQLCAAPGCQGTGVGYELLRRSLQALDDEGVAEVSLTVTASNAPAIRLYERFGFRAIYQFEALVWDRL